MYQSAPSTFGISVMSGASRWLDAVARSGVIAITAPTKTIAHNIVVILVMIWPAIVLVVSIRFLPDLSTVVPQRREGWRGELDAGVPRRLECRGHSIYERGARSDLGWSPY